MVCKDQKAGQLSYTSIEPSPGLRLYAGYIIGYLFNEVADIEIFFDAGITYTGILIRCMCRL